MKRLIQTLVCLGIVIAGGFVYENAQSKQLDAPATRSQPRIPAAVQAKLAESGRANWQLDYCDPGKVTRYDFVEKPHSKTIFTIKYSFRDGQILLADEWTK